MKPSGAWHMTAARILMVAACGIIAAPAALAHLVLVDPVPRSQANGLTDYPCGGESSGDPLRTYVPGSDVEITVNLVIEHVNGLQAWISYDNFATRTQLASASTSGTGTYRLGGVLPEKEGTAVIQATDGTYVSCADVVVGEATPFEINAGISDAWYNPGTDGQGFMIVVFEDIGQLFLAWFTYDAERPPDDVTSRIGEPGHRWLTAQGPYQGNAAVLDVVITTGGVFDSSVPAPVNSEPGAAGSIEVEFTDCANGMVRYDLPGAGKTGQVPIQRIVDSKVSLCQALATP